MIDVSEEGAVSMLGIEYVVICQKTVMFMVTFERTLIPVK